MICFHKWSVIEKQYQESAMDQLAKAGYQNVKASGPAYFRRDAIVTYRCTKCGTEKVERV